MANDRKKFEQAAGNDFDLNKAKEVLGKDFVDDFMFYLGQFYENENMSEVQRKTFWKMLLFIRDGGDMWLFAKLCRDYRMTKIRKPIHKLNNGRQLEQMQQVLLGFKLPYDYNVAYPAQVFYAGFYLSQVDEKKLDELAERLCANYIFDDKIKNTLWTVCNNSGPENFAEFCCTLKWSETMVIHRVIFEYWLEGLSICSRREEEVSFGVLRKFPEPRVLHLDIFDSYGSIRWKTQAEIILREMKAI